MNKDNFKIAVICFFTAYPSVSGSARVCYDFFSCLKIKNKKLFQYSSEGSKNKKIENIMIKNHTVFKILYLPLLIYKISNFFKKTKKKIIFIEGPSWAFYSFVLILFFKVFKSDYLVVYRSHSIEYEIRKKNSTSIISFLTFFFEKLILQLSDIATSVSPYEQRKFYKYYKIKTYLFPNSVSYKKLKNIKIKKIKVPRKYIFFCGSYLYKPNRKAIDIIISKILNRIKDLNIKLVLTGGGFKIKNKQIVNLNILNDSELKYVYKKSLAVVAPIFEGYGTRIKFIEALFYNCNIISTHLGFEGLKKNKNVFLTNKINSMVKRVIVLNRKKKNKKNTINLDYSMEKNIEIFFKKYEKKLFN